MNTAIYVDQKKVFNAPSQICILHILDQRIIFLYNPSSLIRSSSNLISQIPISDIACLESVNRNIYMINYSGKVLWRIRSDANHYNPWTAVGLDSHDTSRWIATTNDGYEYDLDIVTGNLSNGLFMR